jgi:hypothetical protein
MNRFLTSPAVGPFRMWHLLGAVAGMYLPVSGGPARPERPLPPAMHSASARRAARRPECCP